MVDRFSSGPYGRHGGLPLRRHGGLPLRRHEGLPLRRNGGLANTTVLWRKDLNKLRLSLPNQGIQNRCQLLMTILGKPMGKKETWQTCTEHFFNRIGHFQVANSRTFLNYLDIFCRVGAAGTQASHAQYSS